MDTREKPSFHGFTFVYVVTGAAFLVLIALDRGGIGRTILKALPVSTLIVLVLRDIRGFPGIFLTGALLGSVCGDVLLDLREQPPGVRRVEVPRSELVDVRFEGQHRGEQRRENRREQRHRWRHGRDDRDQGR